MTSRNEQISDEHTAGQSRRGHVRTAASGRVLAQVLDSEDGKLIGHTFHSDIVEISATGMRLIAAIPLDNCCLELFVRIDGLARTMLLKTRVRWTRLDASGDFHVGTEICDTPESDTEAWCEFQRDRWEKGL